MAEQLKNTLSFVNLVAGATVVLPHGLNTGNTGPRPIAPDVIFIPSPNLTVTASDEVAVTLTNQGPETLSGSILVEAWHTIERAFNGVQNVDLPMKPYVVVSVENNGAPPQPPFPVPQVETVIFVRNGGNDTTGDGKTIPTAYLTIPRAVQDVPNPIPPGYNYVIDDTDLVTTLPDNYVLPAWVCPDVRRGFEFTDPVFFYNTSVTIRATPRLVSTLSVADATVTMADIFSVVANPKSGLLTITLTAPRASWAGNAIRGKFAIGSGNSLEHCYIGETTDAGGVNGGATFEIAETILPTTPITIREASAFLTGNGTTQDRGALNAINIGSIGINGQNIVNVGPSFYSLWAAGNGFIAAQMNEMVGPKFESSSLIANRITKSAFKDFVFIQGNFAMISGGMLNCIFLSPAAMGPGVPLFRNMIIDGCDPIETQADDIGGPGFLPASSPEFAMTNCVVRNNTGAGGAGGEGIKFHGSRGDFRNVDVYGNVGNGITADAGSGYLNLENVGTTGAANGGVGVRVNDGIQVKVDAATSAALNALTGAGGDMQVGVLPVRTWANFTGAAPINNEYDLVGQNAGATDQSTGSRLSQ